MTKIKDLVTVMVESARLIASTPEELYELSRAVTYVFFLHMEDDRASLFEGLDETAKAGAFAFYDTAVRCATAWSKYQSGQLDGLTDADLDRYRRVRAAVEPGWLKLIARSESSDFWPDLVARKLYQLFMVALRSSMLDQNVP
jgi:hypothetical protein